MAHRRVLQVGTGRQDVDLQVRSNPGEGGKHASSATDLVVTDVGVCWGFSLKVSVCKPLIRLRHRLLGRWTVSGKSSAEEEDVPL